MELQNTQLTDAMGTPAVVKNDLGDLCPLTLFDGLKTLVWNMPFKDLHIGDSETARFILGGLTKAQSNGNKLQLDQGQFDWLTKVVNDHSTPIFGVNAVCLRDSLGDQWQP